MARSRNIKPALFKNELLGTQDPLITLLFINLWCLADRDGLLEDRPLRIKAETFPYRDISLQEFNGYLTVMERLEFIHRYESNGVKVIKIINFAKHQHPHHTEKSSGLPDITDDQIKENLIKSSTSANEEINNGYLTVKQPLNNGDTPADSLKLIPDSLSSDCGYAFSPKAKTVRAKGKQIPDDFVVTEHHETLAMENDWPSPHDEIDAFRDYHIARGTVFKDWDRAFYTWLRNAKKFAKSKISKIGAEDGQRNRPRTNAERFWEDLEDRWHEE